MSENRCICCGEIIPEGRMVCKICESVVFEREQVYVIYHRHHGKTYYMELIEKCKKLIGLKN